MGDFNSLTVVELKNLLREQGLAVSGKKPDLISRLEEPPEEFLVIDEEENTVTVSIEKPKQIQIEKSTEKIETNCPFCGTKLKYPPDYFGNLICPRCNKKFNVKPAWNLGLGAIGFYSSVGVLILTIIIALIVSGTGNDNADGQLGSGMAAGAVCMFVLSISGGLFGLTLLFGLVNLISKKHLNR